MPNRLIRLARELVLLRARVKSASTVGKRVIDATSVATPLTTIVNSCMSGICRIARANHIRTKQYNVCAYICEQNCNSLCAPNSIQHMHAPCRSSFSSNCSCGVPLPVCFMAITALGYGGNLQPYLYAPRQRRV